VARARRSAQFLVAPSTPSPSGALGVDSGYKWRGTDAGHADNVALRRAMELGVDGPGRRALRCDSDDGERAGARPRPYRCLWPTCGWRTGNGTAHRPPDVLSAGTSPGNGGTSGLVAPMFSATSG